MDTSYNYTYQPSEIPLSYASVLNSTYHSQPSMQELRNIDSSIPITPGQKSGEHRYRQGNYYTVCHPHSHMKNNLMALYKN